VTDERLNTVSHLFAACFALVGAALLIAQAGAQGDAWKIVGFSIYGLSIVTLFVASTLHHGLDHSPRVNEVLRTLDYDSVFFLIAGSTTPLVLVLFRSTYGWTVLGAVWAIATLGIVLRSMVRALPKYVTNTLYISLGWVPVLLAGAGGDLPFGAYALMAAGGLVYSAGFVLFVIEKPNPFPGVFGFHEIWHLMVVVAALLHYLLVYVYVLPA
jgi:hemolysin III